MSRTTTGISITPEEIKELLKLFPHGVVAIDLETTGLSPLVDRIIEVAAVKITPYGEQEVFHQLINPLTEILPENARIHGLTNDDLKDAPTIKRPLKSLWDFVGRTPLLAHNALFDAAFLVKASHDFLLHLPQARVFDSARFARALLKKPAEEGFTPPANFRLSTLAEYFSFPLQHHVALEDSFACLKIMASLIARTPMEKMQEFKERSFALSMGQYKKDDSFILPSRFEELKPLIRAQTLIDINYTGGTVAEEWRPVRPIALIPMPKGPVLYAVCLITNMNKSFLLKRIKGFRITAVPQTGEVHAEVEIEISE